MKWFGYVHAWIVAEEPAPLFIYLQPGLVTPANVVVGKMPSYWDNFTAPVVNVISQSDSLASLQSFRVFVKVLAAVHFFSEMMPLLWSDVSAGIEREIQVALVTRITTCIFDVRAKQ